MKFDKTFFLSKIFQPKKWIPNLGMEPNNDFKAILWKFISTKAIHLKLKQAVSLLAMTKLFCRYKAEGWLHTFLNVCFPSKGPRQFLSMKTKKLSFVAVIGMKHSQLRTIPFTGKELFKCFQPNCQL